MADRRTRVVLHVDEYVLNKAFVNAGARAGEMRRQLERLRRLSRIRRFVSFGLWR